MATMLLLLLPISTLTLPTNPELQQQICQNQTSCSSCISKSFCVWCIISSECSKSSCRNENAIYPEFIEPSAMMAGEKFCPKIAEEKPIALRSGQKLTVNAKLSQLHLHMTYTVWKCKIVFDSKQAMVDAVLIGDRVHCNTVVLSNRPGVWDTNGGVQVFWNRNKALDGVIPVKVCRCELYPDCPACKG